MKPKILIVVIHGPYEPWLSILQDGQSKTWMESSSKTRIINAFGIKIHPKLLKADQEIYYLRWSDNKILAYASLLLELVTKKIFRLHTYQPEIISVKNQGQQEVWEVQMPDSLMLQGVKNMAVFRNSLSCEFDFLVTTITSTYLNVSALEEYLDKTTQKNFLGGRIEKSGTMKFQQGSFRVFSRDMVLKIVENSHSYQHWKIEDIALGRLLSSLSPDFTPIPNLTVESQKEIESILEPDLRTTVSYRCKSTSSGRRIDADLMKLLHQRILKIL
jgi:hypothetical protein